MELNRAAKDDCWPWAVDESFFKPWKYYHVDTWTHCSFIAHFDHMCANIMDVGFLLDSNDDDNNNNNNNNTHEKITRFWLAESSAVQV